MKFDTMRIYFKGDGNNPVAISYDNILHLDFQNVTNAYYLNRYSDDNTEESSVQNFKSKMAEKVFINIHKDANEELQSGKYATVFEKIVNRQDIFYIEFLLGKSSIEKVRVPWNNKHNFEEYNYLEDVYDFPNGNLGIVIKF